MKDKKLITVKIATDNRMFAVSALDKIVTTVLSQDGEDLNNEVISLAEDTGNMITIIEDYDFNHIPL